MKLEGALFDSSAERAVYGATLTFENAEGKTFTIVRDNMGVRKAVASACATAYALDPTFRCVCVSTPESIYRDLYGRQTPHGRAQLKEGMHLAHAGFSEMLHDRLASRNVEKWTR